MSGVKFTEGSASRIARVVIKAESDGGTLRPQGSPKGAARSTEWHGVVVCEGFNQQGDFADNRYWVAAAYISNGVTKKDFTDPVTWTAFPTGHPYHRIVTAHNKTEAGAGTHLLEVGTPVTVLSLADSIVPQTTRFFFL